MGQDRTLTKKIEELQLDGYTDNIILTEGQLIDANTKAEYELEDMEVEGVHRFDGMTNPEDESILYAICCKNRKGLFVESFGVYQTPKSDRVKQRFIKEIKKYNDAK